MVVFSALDCLRGRRRRVVSAIPPSGTSATASARRVTCGRCGSDITPLAAALLSLWVDAPGWSGAWAAQGLYRLQDTVSVKSPLWLPAGKRSPGERGESRPTDGGPADRGAFRLAPAWVWWALASEIAVSALLCSVSIGSKSLWQDEGSSVSFARDSFTQLLRVEWHSEENQTLYYGLLHWWIRLGSTEADLRSLSAIAAVAAVAATFLLARRLFGDTTAAVAGLLMATAPFAVEWAQNVRGYTLVML